MKNRCKHSSQQDRLKKCAQDAQKSPQDRFWSHLGLQKPPPKKSLNFFFDPETLPKRFQDASWTLLATFLLPGPFFLHFGSTFCRCWVVFSSNLCALLVNFGVYLCLFCASTTSPQNDKIYPSALHPKIPKKSAGGGSPLCGLNYDSFAKG